MGKTLRIVGVKNTQLKHVWSDVAPQLRRALKHAHGTLTLGEIHNGIQERNMQLWLVLDGDEMIVAYVTQIKKYPLVKALIMLVLGGSRVGEWVSEVNESIKRFAKDQGCSRVEYHGRKGWSNMLKNLGWKHMAITMGVEV